jgi:hypothetical protein
MALHPPSEPYATQAVTEGALRHFLVDLDLNSLINPEKYPLIYRDK